MLTIITYGTDRHVVTAPMAGTGLLAFLHCSQRSGIFPTAPGIGMKWRKRDIRERTEFLSSQVIGQGLRHESVTEIVGRSPDIR